MSSSESRDVEIDSHGELIASIPALLGYVPTESVILIVTAAGYLDCAVRMDLHQAREAVTRMRISPFEGTRRPDITVHIVIVADADQPATGAPIPYAALAEEVSAALARSGVQVTHPAWVPALEAGVRWHCHAGRTCGGVLDDPRATHLAARRVLEGRILHPDRQDMADLLKPEPAEVLDRRAHAAAQLSTTRTPDHHRDTQLVAQAVAAAQQGRLPHGDHAIVDLALALSHRSVRDWCITHCTDLDQRDAAQQLWITLVRGTPPGLRAQPAVLLAVTAYLQGDGALLSLALDTVLAADPGNTFAALLRTAILHGLTPTQFNDFIAVCRRG